MKENTYLEEEPCYTELIQNFKVTRSKYALLLSLF